MQSFWKVRPSANLRFHKVAPEPKQLLTYALGYRHSIVHMNRSVSENVYKRPFERWSFMCHLLVRLRETTSVFDSFTLNIIWICPIKNILRKLQKWDISHITICLIYSALNSERYLIKIL
jgi:hypothetical protein